MRLPSFITLFTRPAALVLGASLLSACATMPPASDPEAVAEYEAINDPIEPLNRAMFTVNEALDTWFLRPAAVFYRGMIPPPVQDVVHNFLNNLTLPIVFLNDVLQGEGARAGDTAGRFIVNTTIGIAGLFDPADEMGLKAHKEDFGQTLATWGTGEGFYIVLPVFGPSNPRDAAGMVVDTLADPFGHWSRAQGARNATHFARAGRMTDWRARNFDDVEDMRAQSLDFYATIRSLYRQNRAFHIKNGVSNGKLQKMNGAMLMDDPMMVDMK